MTDTSVEHDPYALSTGLPDDFSGTITEAYFAADTGFTQDGSAVTVLQLSVATGLPDNPVETLKVSCGSGWEIEDQGGRVVRVGTEKQQFNQSSNMGILIAHAIKAGALDTMRSRGVPQEAKTWEGLTFHWNRLTLPGRDGTESKPKLLPTKFLGVNGGTSTPAPAAAADSAVSPLILAKLKKAARDSASYDEFMVAGFEIEGIDDNQAAIDLITSEAFYSENHG
jgi:hypothetical protein